MWNGGDNMALPFENNTDRAIKRIAQASLESERRRNLLAGLIVFGAAFLLSFAAILAGNATLALEVSEGVTSDRELVTVLFGVALVVLLAAGLAIRNIMYLSVLGRTREFAQLRTLGATNRQIRCIVSAERRRMTRSWLATGVLAGFFGNVLLPLEFFWVQSASMAVAAAAFTWFVVYLSFRAPAKQAARVSPMDGLRQTAMLGIGQPRRKGRLVRSTSRTIAHHSAHLSPGAIGRRWLSSDQKKTVLTLASLIFSGALLFVLFTVMAAIDIDTLARQPYYEDSSLYSKINSTADEDSTYRIMRTAPFSDALREEILAIPGVERIVPLAMLDVTLPDVGFEGAIQSVMPRTLAPRLVEGVLAGKATEEDILPVTINRASPYYQETGLDLSVGDRVTATIDTGAEERTVQFEVVGILENKDDGVVFYTDTENLQALAAMDCTLAWYIVATPESAEDVTQAVQRLVTADERLYVGNLADDIASYEAYFANARLAVSVLALLILVFAFLNLLNTCIVNSVIRQREFALLAAVGMTRQQLVQAQRVENAVYFGASFFGSWLIGGALGWAICRWLSEIPGLGYIHYQFPIAFLLCYALFVAVSAFAVQHWQTHRLAEKSIVEQLREIA